MFRALRRKERLAGEASRKSAVQRRAAGRRVEPADGAASAGGRTGLPLCIEISGSGPGRGQTATSRSSQTSTVGIRAVVDNGDDALRSKLESWEPETRAALARALAELA